MKSAGCVPQADRVPSGMRSLWGFFRKRPKLAAAFFGTLTVAILGIALGWPWIVAGWRQQNAEELAVDYGQKLYPDQKGHYATCQSRDTDGNGYISCTLRVVRQDDTEELIPLECTSYLLVSFGDTCRQVSTVRPSGR